MKKALIFLISVVVCTPLMQAQYDDLYTFEKGKSLIGVNIGVGFGNNGSASYSAFYEYCPTTLFVDECTLGTGFFGGYYSAKLGGEVERVYIVGLKLNVHYQFIDRLDTYIGTDPNFNIDTYKLQKDHAQFAIYFHLGGRYYLNNWLGVFAEASTGYNTFSGGLSVKF